MKKLKYIVLTLIALIATATISAQTQYCDMIGGERVQIGLVEWVIHG